MIEKRNVTMAKNSIVTTHSDDKKARNPVLDRIKGFLVIGMVLSHTLNFFPVGPPMFCVVFSTYISTMTFPGFLFVLGYVSQYAYFSKDRDYAAKRIFLGFVKSMLALYACGIFFTFFMQRDFSLRGFLDKFLLRELPSYSEFLLSFALLYLVMLLFFPFLKNMSDRTILVLCACSVAMTFSLTISSHIPCPPALSDVKTSARSPLHNTGFIS